MAVSLGHSPERVLQGFDRCVAMAADWLPTRPSTRSGVPARWVIERGSVIASASVDALGGFPGSIMSGNVLPAVQVLVTPRYLVVGEGMAQGFALMHSRVLGVAVVRPDHACNPSLVVHYQDGPDVGTFGLRVRGLARNVSGAYRAETIASGLYARGVPELDPETARERPDLYLGWDRAREYAHERLLWRGVATAPVGGWFGAQRQVADVWLTDASLIWCAGQGDGLHRLPLRRVRMVRDNGSGMVVVGVRLDHGGRYGLAFAFAEADRACALVAKLAALGIPVSDPTPVLAPWRRGGSLRPMDR